MILPLKTDTDQLRPAYGTLALVLINIAIHLLWTFQNEEAIIPYAMAFDDIRPLQWLTSAFLHGSWLHLLGNMLFLWTFGVVAEHLLGRRFLPVYLAITVLSGALLQSFLYFRGDDGLGLGASAAIFGLLCVCLLWSPESRITMLVWPLLSKPFIRPIRMVWVGVWYVGWEIFTVATSGAVISSALLHLGGIVAGVVIGGLMLRCGGVQCHGWDLPSMMRRGWKAPNDPSLAPAPATPQTTTQRISSGTATQTVSTATSRWAPPATLHAHVQQLNQAVLAKDALQVRRLFHSLQERHRHWSIPCDVLDDVAESLLAGGDGEGALDAAQRRLRTYPEHGSRMLLVAAEALIVYLDKPSEGLSFLRRLQTQTVSPEQLERHARLCSRAERRLRATTRIARPSTVRVTAAPDSA